MKQIESSMKYFFSILLFCCAFYWSNAQTISIDTALSWAIRNNPDMKVAILETSRQMALTRGSSEIPKTDVSLLYGQYNSIQKNDNNISVEQTIPFPSVWARQKKLNKELVISSMLNERVTENLLKYEVGKIFNHLLYLKAKSRMLSQQDSLMRGMARAVDFQYKTGESTLLAKTSADTKLMELENQRKRNDADRQIYLDKLRFLCREDFTDVQGEFSEINSMIAIDSAGINKSPLVAFATQEVSIAHEKTKLEEARLMPDIRVGYFTQTLIGFQNIQGTEQHFGSDERFQGFHVGLSIPLWYAPFKARIKAAALSGDIAKEQEERQMRILQQQYNQVRQELIKNTNSLSYFSESALQASRMLRYQSDIAFKNGEIDYKVHLLNLQQALSVEEEYLNTQYEYNQNIITLNYLTGNYQK